MVFCSRCGKELPEDAYFCPSCGARTQKGSEAGVSTPADEFRDAFVKVSQELERAFGMAAKEIQEAFKTAGENIQKATGKGRVVCSNCGEKNTPHARFCYKCGKKLD
jgi:predicted amidophosphoribosyltransferase